MRARPGLVLDVHAAAVLLGGSNRAVGTKALVAVSSVEETEKIDSPVDRGLRAVGARYALGRASREVQYRPRYQLDFTAVTTGEKRLEAKDLIPGRSTNEGNRNLTSATSWQAGTTRRFDESNGIRGVGKGCRV